MGGGRWQISGNASWKGRSLKWGKERINGIGKAPQIKFIYIIIIFIGGLTDTNY